MGKFSKIVEVVSGTEGIIELLFQWVKAINPERAQDHVPNGRPAVEAEKLRKALDENARDAFRMRYDYEYNDAFTDPPNMDRNYQKYPHREFVTVKVDDIAAVRNYIDTEVVNDIPGKHNYREKMANDLTGAVDGYINTGGAGFNLSPYDPQIEPDDDPTGMEVLKVDGVVIHAKVPVNKDEEYLFLQYCGIAYFEKNDVPP